MNQRCSQVHLGTLACVSDAMYSFAYLWSITMAGKSEARKKGWIWQDLSEGPAS